MGEILTPTRSIHEIGRSTLTLLIVQLWHNLSTHAESPIAVGTGFEYAIGDYGGDTDIEFIFIPFLFFYQTGRWWTEVEIPWIQLKAPDDSITLGDGSVIVGKKPRLIQGKATRPCTDTGNVP